MSEDRQRPLRADAERNRRLIMDTAERLFAERGSVATLNEIAHEAGVGVGTVYRRFPDLSSLMNALFAERFTTFLQLAETAADHAEAGQALRHYLVEAARRRAGDPALDVILAHADLEVAPAAGMRDELGRRVDALVERAVAAGAVREGFASTDVYAYLYMIGAVADRTRGVAPDAWLRYVDVLLRGFGLEPATAMRQPAMTDAQILSTWPKP